MWKKLKSFVGIKLSQPIIDDLPQCDICLQKFNKDNFTNLCNCEHKFCNECVQNHVDSKIKSYEIIGCPEGQCKAEINETGQFYLKLQKEKHKIYQKIKRFHFVSKNPNFKLCPKQQCQGMINIRILKSSTCNVCGESYCTKCLYKQHQGKCQKQSILHLQNDLKFIQCMNCDFIIEKNQGCDHIKCRCGFQLCYKCGGLWKGSGHLCIRSKKVQKMRSACLFIQGKITSTYKNSPLEGFMKQFMEILKIILYFNVISSALTAFVEIFLSVFFLVTSIFFTYNDTEIKSDQIQISVFQTLWPYAFWLISISIGLFMVYLDGKMITNKGKINFAYVIFATLVAYYFLPNLFYFFYYEALIILFVFENSLLFIGILLSIFSIWKVIMWKSPKSKKFVWKYLNKMK